MTLQARYWTQQIEPASICNPTRMHGGGHPSNLLTHFLLFHKPETNVYYVQAIIQDFDMTFFFFTAVTYPTLYKPKGLDTMPLVCHR